MSSDPREREGVAEEALWESEARLKLLLEQIPAILWTTDRELRSTMSQGAGLATLGLQPNQLAGRTLFDYFQTTDRQYPPIAAHIRALAGESVDYASEWGGRSFEAHVRPLRDSDGEIVGTLGMSLDVTDRKRLEAADRERTDALRRSEERHRDLYEKERAVREQGERLRAATAALGSTLDLGELLAVILRELRGVVPYDTASVQEFRGGCMEVIAGHGFSTLDGIIGARFDVAANNPNREVFRTRRPVVVDNAPAAFDVFAAGAHVKTPVKSWIGIPLLFHDRVIGMLSVDKNEAGFYSAEHARMAEAFAAPAAVAIENARLYAAARAEVEERKRVEDQFRQSQKMEAVGRLAGGIAHDFNNLLGVILGYTEIATGKLEAGHPALPKLDEVRAAADRAASLTRQLLAFSRKQVLVPEVLDLGDVVNDLSVMLRRVIGEDVELATLVHGPLGRVRADRGQVEQAIVNLAINARDAMPGGGKLLIEASEFALAPADAATHPLLETGRYVVLAVSDTGTGMTAEVASQIFEPFFTTKEPGRGTGLGLSMVYGFLEQSGGRVTVDTRIDRGTTFRMYFPRLDDEARAPAAAAVATAAPEGGTETVLLAEDAGALREMIAEILASSGYRVLEAATGERALEVAKAHEGPIHLLLTDVVMPGMNGAELAAAVGVLRPESRILYMSGYTDDAVVHRGVLSEGASLLQKPFASTGLLHKVREVLDRAI
jgi:PAS domain S-box-containing protein